jgi:hypothetical protein
MRELLGNRPGHIPTGLGNSSSDADVSVLDTGVPASEPHIEVKGDSDSEGSGSDEDDHEDQLQSDAAYAKVSSEFDSAASAVTAQLESAPIAAHDHVQVLSTEDFDMPAGVKVKAKAKGKKPPSAIKTPGKTGKKTAAAASISAPAVKTEPSVAKKSRNPTDRFAEAAVKEEETNQRLIDLKKAKALAETEKSIHRDKVKAELKLKDQELRSKERIRRMELEHSFRIEQMKLQASMGVYPGQQFYHAPQQFQSWQTSQPGPSTSGWNHKPKPHATSPCPSTPCPSTPRSFVDEISSPDLDVDYLQSMGYDGNKGDETVTGDHCDS